MGDLAATLARRGQHVVVLTADRGYDDPSRAYPRRETSADGVHVRRLAATSFGKSTLTRRALAIASYMTQVLIVLIGLRDLDAIVFSTSPPFVGVIAALIGELRRVPTVFWAMDLNPDQLIALGKLAPDSTLARVFRTCNRFFLHRAARVVALDTVMARRLVAAGAPADRTTVTPPWSPDDDLAPVPREQNVFRRTHGLEQKTVVMYSGNHTPSNPLRTLLDAAVRLQDVRSLRFVFVGSGLAKRDVEHYATEYALDSIVSLPYQPRESLADSLSAADIHVVSLGDAMAGIIHPCKVYGAMAVSRPILYFGPRPSHVTEIVERHGNGWIVAHGDVDTAERVLREIAATPTDTLDRMGAAGAAAVASSLDPRVLCAAVADAVTDALAQTGSEA